MSEPITDTETRTAQLVMLDQQLALSAYLHALLQPAPVETAVPAAAEVAVIREPAVIADPGEREEGPTVAPDTPTVLEPEVQTPPAAAEAVTPPVNPDWAQADFQCLLFRVGGLTLALPLARLHGVLPWDADAVTPMPNHRPWFLGLRTHLGQQVKLVDVAKVVLPADRWPGTEDAGVHGKVILIDGGRWGLVCSDVAEVITLSAAAVKWRSQAGSRRWLAGTVIDRMCALLDTEALAEMLGGEGPMAA